jgi:hypothetical protein
MDRATFWAIFSQTHLVTLLVTEQEATHLLPPQHQKISVVF